MKGTLSLPPILLGTFRNGTMGRVSKSTSSGVWAVGEDPQPEDLWRFHFRIPHPTCCPCPAYLGLYRLWRLWRVGSRATLAQEGKT